MKKLIYLLGIGVIGYIGYKFITNRSGYVDDMITDPPTNSYLQTQPQQEYPMQMTSTPRVDNADQPWYQGTRAFMGDMSLDDSSFSEGSMMSYNTNQFWTELESKYIH